MSAARKPTGWGKTKPPVGPGVNWGNPLTKGLTGYWPLNEGAGKTAFDLARKNNGTFIQAGIGSIPAWDHRGPNLPGPSPTFAGGTSGNGSAIDCGAPAILEMAATDKFTMAAMVRSPAAQINDAFAIGKDVDTGSRGFGFGESTTGQLYLESAGQVAMTSTGPVFGGTGKWTLISVTQSGDSVQTWTAYVNGITIGTANRAGVNYTTNSGAHWYIGGRNYSGFFNGYIGDIAWAAVWRYRELTATEMLRLYTEPFSLIQPRRRRLLYGAPAAGGGGQTFFARYHYDMNTRCA